jgi:hypothetical protein
MVLIPSLFGVAGDDQSNYSINIPASSGWQLYQVNLSNLDHILVMLKL